MKLSRLLTGLSLLFLISNVCKAQFLTLLGSFSYSLNSINQVFDISPDGKIAVAMRNDPSTVQPAFLTTFNPLTGAQFVDTLAANTGDPQNPSASAALSSGRARPVGVQSLDRREDSCAGLTGRCGER
jgi:hypothetical protein